MPTMSRFQAAFCRSAPWRGFARRVVLPWALQGFGPEGKVLEIGHAPSRRRMGEGDRRGSPRRSTWGHIVGYDLLSTAPLRLLHQADGARLRFMRLPELREAVRELPMEQAVLTPSIAGVVVRFALRKSATG